MSDLMAGHAENKAKFTLVRVTRVALGEDSPISMHDPPSLRLWISFRTDMYEMKYGMKGFENQTATCM